MPINRMWQLYEEAVNATTPIEEMRKVAEYCITDALRCQQLMLHHNVVGDYREVAIISYVSFYDSCFNAGGIKVCNLLGAYAHDNNILVSMSPKECT